MNEQNSYSLHLETKILSNAAITSKVLYAFTAKCEELEGGQGDRKVDKENVLKCKRKLYKNIQRSSVLRKWQMW
jgi:hypothetical protein